MGGVSLAALQSVCSGNDWYIGVFPVEMLLGECHRDPTDDETPLVLVAWQHQADGLEQERRNSSALAMELCLSCTNPSKWLLGPVLAQFCDIIWHH